MDTYRPFTTFLSRLNRDVCVKTMIDSLLKFPEKGGISLDGNSNDVNAVRSVLANSLSQTEVAT